MQSGKSLNQLCVEKLQRSAQPLADAGESVCHSGPLPSHLLENIVRRWKLELVGLALFGSAARGDVTVESDVDLLLVMRKGTGILRDLYRQWDELCRESGAVDPDGLSPHFVSLPASVLEAGGLWYEVALEGILLWEHDLQVTRFLRSVRESMAKGRIRRRLLHGSPYWIKNMKEGDAQ